MRAWNIVLTAVAVALSGSAAFAARTDLVSACRWSRLTSIRPPAAAAAIDEVVYANLFEGLTRDRSFR